MKEIKLRVKLEFSETLKLRFNLAYRAPMIVFLTLIGFGMLWIVISHLKGDDIGNNGSFPVLQTGFSFFLLIAIPLSIIRSVHKDIKTNKFISQTIEYIFTDNYFTITGETFNMQNSWTDLNKIVELKNWFIFYTSKTQALFIPKDRFEDESTLENFRSLLKTLDVNKKLL